MVNFGEKAEIKKVMLLQLYTKTIHADAFIRCKLLAESYYDLSKN